MRGLVLDHSDSDRLTPVLNDDLLAVLLDDTLALPASDGFHLVAQSSPSTSHNHCGRVLMDEAIEFSARESSWPIP